MRIAIWGIMLMLSGQLTAQNALILKGQLTEQYEIELILRLDPATYNETCQCQASRAFGETFWRKFPQQTYEVSGTYFVANDSLKLHGETLNRELVRLRLRRDSTSWMGQGRLNGLDTIVELKDVIVEYDSAQLVAFEQAETLASLLANPPIPDFYELPWKEHPATIYHSPTYIHLQAFDEPINKHYILQASLLPNEIPTIVISAAQVLDLGNDKSEHREYSLSVWQKDGADWTSITEDVFTIDELWPSQNKQNPHRAYPGEVYLDSRIDDHVQIELKHRQIVIIKQKQASQILNWNGEFFEPKK